MIQIKLQASNINSLYNDLIQKNDYKALSDFFMALYQDGHKTNLKKLLQKYLLYKPFYIYPQLFWVLYNLTEEVSYQNVLLYCYYLKTYGCCSWENSLNTNNSFSISKKEEIELRHLFYKYGIYSDEKYNITNIYNTLQKLLYSKDDYYEYVEMLFKLICKLNRSYKDQTQYPLKYLKKQYTTSIFASLVYFFIQQDKEQHFQEILIVLENIYASQNQDLIFSTLFGLFKQFRKYYCYNISIKKFPEQNTKTMFFELLSSINKNIQNCSTEQRIQKYNLKDFQQTEQNQYKQCLNSQKNGSLKGVSQNSSQNSSQKNVVKNDKLNTVSVSVSVSQQKLKYLDFLVYGFENEE